MAKYIFTKIPDDCNKFDVTSITFETKDLVVLDDILTEFTCFLRGCGFLIPNVDQPLIIAEDEE